MNTVKSHLAPLLNTSHESVQDIDQELKYVARVLRKLFLLFNPESHGGGRMIL